MIVEVREAAPLVDRWRRQYTQDADLGIPAHITLLVPFVAAEQLDAETEDRLAGLLGSSKSFDFVLARTGRFPTTLYLAPEPAQPFIRLTQAIVEEWPDHPPYAGEVDAIVPHLTVADSEDQALLDRIAAEMESDLPIEGKAREAQLLEQNRDGSWSERRRLPFAGGA